MSRVKNLRLEKGITLEQLAEILHTNTSTLSRIENDKRELKEDFIRECSNFFNVSADYLLGRSDDRNRRHDIRRPSDAIRIPVLGHVAAGIPLDAIQEGRRLTVKSMRILTNS